MRTQVCFVAAFILVLTGCQALNAPGARGSIPPPPLQLLSLDDIQVPSDCDVRGATTYRTRFQVDRGGHARDVVPEVTAPSCLRDALARWVTSFRYVPPAEDTATAIEWLPVIARRGG